MRIIWKNPPAHEERATLDDFLQGFADGLWEDMQRYAHMMVRLLRYLEEYPAETDLWAYTQHSYVRFYIPGIRDPDVRVQVVAGAYEIMYAWPDPPSAPWPNASIVCHTTNTVQAGRLMLTALRYSHDRTTDQPIVHASLPDEPQEEQPTSTCSDIVPGGPETKEDPSAGNPTPLRRVSTQQPETLEEHYIKLQQDAQGPFFTERSQAMLELVQYLQEHGIGTNQWVYTSAIRLILTDTDQLQSGVEIDRTPINYIVSYPSSLPGQPCDNVRIVGKADDVATTAHLIQTAIQRTSYS